MSNIENRDIAIIGGGMVGLGLACALRHLPLKITIFERSEGSTRLSLGRDCRVSAIVAGTYASLQGIGVWDQMDVNKVNAIEGMRIWDDQHPGGVRFEASEINVDALGYLVENSVLRQAMLDTLHDAENVEICCPAEVQSIEVVASGATLKLEGGRSFAASLLVAADGGRSWVREQLGIGVYAHDYHQKAIVATIKPQFSHRNCAYQRFLPTGPLALLPLTKGCCSIVWSLENHEAERIMALDDAMFLDALNLAFGPQLGHLEQAGDRAIFPLKAQLAHHIVRPRLALIGDAAHVVHPLAGLGVNLGLRDAMVLAQEIADALTFKEDIGELSTLHRFMKARIPDQLAVLTGMQLFHHLFTQQLPMLPQLRGAAMVAISNSGAVKRLLMRTASGLSLPIPVTIHS
ncbi:MAG: UbiH/UbiF/VisC/COQ6 family ubiquinone biosynthesis hydroxylase [Mariprofundaceae bacterium]